MPVLGALFSRTPRATMLAPWSVLANLASDALLVFASQSSQEPLQTTLQSHHRFYDVQVSPDT